jgi:tRNA pseudouridine55 synthase
VRLGCGAHLAGLRRLRAGAFGLAEAVAAERLEPAHREHLCDRLVALDELLPELAAVRLTARGLTRVRHGQDVGPADLESGPPPPDGPVRLLDEQGRLVGIAELVSGEGVLHPSVVLG